MPRLDLRVGSKVYGPGVAIYTIGETAERSGFSASTLRYYEGIGLVEPSTRTAAGYRLYDDHALSRLQFVARAKQLGCSLEEITDLVGLWDGERCGPVQRRLHDLVTAKLDGAQRQIDELTALVDQLRDTAALLAGPASDGPCDATCACLAIADPEELMEPIPIYDATAPIACTIGPDEIAGRLDQVERLRSVLDRIERTDVGLLLHFPSDPEVEADLTRFAVDEKRCCAFWGFDVLRDGSSLRLRWDGPPAADELLDQLLGYFRGERELPDLLMPR